MEMEIVIGPVPHREEREEREYGRAYNPQKALREALAFLAQLLRQHGPAPDGVRVLVKSWFRYNRPEVGLLYDTSVPGAAEYAEGFLGAPAEWDEEAKAELAAYADIMGR